MRKGLLTLLCLLCLVGCQSISPRAELRIAQIGFEGVVESLTELYLAGQIGADEQEVIGHLIHEGRDLLEAWTESVKEAGERPKTIQPFHKILSQLVEWEIRKKGTAE